MRVAWLDNQSIDRPCGGELRDRTVRCTTKLWDASSHRRTACRAGKSASMAGQRDREGGAENGPAFFFADLVGLLFRSISDDVAYHFFRVWVHGTTESERGEMFGLRLRSPRHARPLPGMRDYTAC